MNDRVPFVLRYSASADLDARRLAVVAHHEAGHAVAAIRLGRAVASLTTIPDYMVAEPYDGCIFLASVGGRSGGLARSFAVANIIVSLAGPAAQRRFRPRSGVADSARGDHDDCDRLAGVISCDMASENALRRHCAIEARALVKANWAAVKAVAEAAMHDRILSGTTIRAIVDLVDEKGRRTAADAAARATPDEMAAAVISAAQRRRREMTIPRGLVAEAALHCMAGFLSSGVAPDVNMVREHVGCIAEMRGRSPVKAIEKFNAILAENWRPVARGGAA